MKKFTLAVVTGALLFPLLSSHAQVKNAKLTAIRAYLDGNMHLYVDRDISAACGQVVRFQGPGQENVRALALAAMMSGRALEIEATAAKNGNFCDLIFVRLEES